MGSHLSGIGSWIVSLLMAQEPGRKPSGPWTAEEEVLHQKAIMLLKRWKNATSAQLDAKIKVSKARLGSSSVALVDANRELANADAVERQTWHDLQTFEIEARSRHGGQLPPWWPK
jgi:hypothetical protein